MPPGFGIEGLYVGLAHGVVVAGLSGLAPRRTLHVDVAAVAVGAAELNRRIDVHRFFIGMGVATDATDTLRRDVGGALARRRRGRHGVLDLLGLLAAGSQQSGECQGDEESGHFEFALHRSSLRLSRSG